MKQLAGLSYGGRDSLASRYRSYDTPHRPTYRVLWGRNRYDYPTLNEATDALFHCIDSFPIGTTYELYTLKLNGHIDGWEIVGREPRDIFSRRLASLWRINL